MYNFLSRLLDRAAVDGDLLEPVIDGAVHLEDGDVETGGDHAAGQPDDVPVPVTTCWQGCDLPGKLTNPGEVKEKKVE